MKEKISKYIMTGYSSVINLYLMNIEFRVENIIRLEYVLAIMNILLQKK
jgi:hypothetical protein